MSYNQNAPRDLADTSIDRVGERAVEVVVPGVPTVLSYRVPPGTRVSVGHEATVEVGRRKAHGWVVRERLLETVLEELEFKLQAAVDEQSSHPQLSLLSGDAYVRRSLELKPVLESSPAFLPDQLPLFEWMAEYYGSSLVEVIDTAVPQRKTSSRTRNVNPTGEGATKFLESPFSTPKPETLTTSQAQALSVVEEALKAKVYSSLLLFGVTGSGKTEIYLRAIEQIMDEGGTALIIVPEISLTPQLIDRFQSRLGVPLAVLHSQVGAGARWSTWQGLLDGKFRLALGARSAVFAPLSDLRLIIDDEEHESSYKQSESLRYHGRDVAVMRAKLLNAAAVLGSATPSFESLFNAMRKRYRLIEMPERATSRPLPEIETINLNRIKKKEMVSPSISPQLFDSLKTTLDSRGQAIILYNRRGFSSYLQCESCSEVVVCPNCSVALTFHKREARIMCHYCGISRPAPTQCAFCRDPRTTRIALDIDGEPLEKSSVTEKTGLLTHRGGGTERVVEELKQLFPEAIISRMDRDTVTKKDAYRDILMTMRSGRADILVGTQMIAKGHDLPGVTLVGIIDADVGLHMPDFRSSEKIFQLITQAAGRAGRGREKGRVLVQTREPNHPTIVATVTGRFKAFARFDLDQRKALGYPPWGRLLRLIVSSPDSGLAMKRAIETAQFVQSLVAEFKNEALENKTKVLGPAPAPLLKLRGRYRHHILVKSVSAKNISQLAHAVSAWRDKQKGSDDVRVAIDVDPVDMM